MTTATKEIAENPIIAVPYASFLSVVIENSFT